MTTPTISPANFPVSVDSAIYNNLLDIPVSGNVPISDGKLIEIDLGTKETVLKPPIQGEKESAKAQVVGPPIRIIDWNNLKSTIDSELGVC